jgi:hypothetical protein
MHEIKDINWFKRKLSPILKNYEIKYRFYKEGDFGSLHQVIFESSEKGGGVDFWGLGWIGVDLYDYKRDEQLLNVLLEPDQEEEKTKVFNTLQELL